VFEAMPAMLSQPATRTIVLPDELIDPFGRNHREASPSGIAHNLFRQLRFLFYASDNMFPDTFRKFPFSLEPFLAFIGIFLRQGWRIDPFRTVPFQRARTERICLFLWLYRYLFLHNRMVTM
jgi:hypothetical protein